MQVFKTALRLVARSPIALLLYIVFFGLLGLIVVASNADSFATTSIESSQSAESAESAESSESADSSTTAAAQSQGILPTAAIIDRDNSTVSKGLASFLAERSTPVAVADNTRALQDAAARNEASYLLIIPEGFGTSFIAAAREGSEPPLLQTVASFEKSDAVLMSFVTNEYLGALRIAAAGMPDASTTTLLDTASAAASQHVEIQAASIDENTGANLLVVFFFQWIAYPMTTGLIVLVGTIFATFQSGELRRRNLCTPLSPWAANTQIALGCLSVLLLTWGFLMLLALLPISGGWELVTTQPETFGLMALAALAYAFVPFTLGFLLSQCGLKDIALNGLANIISLAFCFISGIFMGGTELLGDEVQAVAHAVPAYWYSQALLSLAQGPSDSGVLTTFFGNIGMVLLFAAVFCAAALIIGRIRARSAEAGGNPAAEVTS